MGETLTAPTAGIADADGLAKIHHKSDVHPSDDEHLPVTPRFCHDSADLVGWIGSDTRFFEFEAPFASDYDARCSRAPSDVCTRVEHIHDELKLIAAKLTAELEPPVVEGRKRPQDVAQQILRATSKTVNLETRLGMGASGVPQMTLVRVTPAVVYEAIGVLLAEMVRIKAHLGINLPRDDRPDARNKKPTDVFAQVLLIIRNLDILGKVAEAT